MNKTVKTICLTFGALAALLAVILGPCSAQQAAPEANAPYRLGAGDVLSIQVINFPELSIAQVTIPPDGKISVPVLRAPITVTGETTESLSKTLTDQWSVYVVNPSVTVSLFHKRQETVMLYGSVIHPEAVDYRPGLRLLAALATAGGPSDVGDLGRVIVTHADGSKRMVDVSAAQTQGGAEADLPLEPDDVVYVPLRHSQISVLGEVSKPGSFDYTDQMTVLDALKVAGPINPETADLSGATLVHNGHESPLDLDSLLRQGRMADNVTLAPGDRLFIPVLHNRTYVAGAVGRPGYYTFRPGDRVLDALNGSGGHTQDADLGKVNLIHVDKLKNVATVQTLDLNKFFQKGDLQANASLLPGDVLYVPTKGHSNKLSDIFSGLSALNIISSTARLLIP